MPQFLHLYNGCNSSPCLMGFCTAWKRRTCLNFLHQSLNTPQAQLQLAPGSATHSHHHGQLGCPWVSLLSLPGSGSSCQPIVTVPSTANLPQLQVLKIERSFDSCLFYLLVVFFLSCGPFSPFLCCRRDSRACLLCDFMKVSPVVTSPQGRWLEWPCPLKDKQPGPRQPPWMGLVMGSSNAWWSLGDSVNGCRALLVFLCSLQDCQLHEQGKGFPTSISWNKARLD